MATLQRFARPRRQAAAPEICDFCSVELASRHRHLLEVSARRVVCVCDPCALRFEGVAGGRFQLIPREVRRLPDFRMTDAQWESLALPIALVFIFQNSTTAKPMALYPGPAGTTESLLTLEHWQNVVADNPVLATMAPDVEALLINRVGDRRDYYLAPMDQCFELTGVIRKHWRGFSGGDSVWREIAAFFAQLRAQSRPVAPAPLAEANYA